MSMMTVNVEPRTSFQTAQIMASAEPQGLFQTLQGRSNFDGKCQGEEATQTKLYNFGGYALNPRTVSNKVLGAIAARCIHVRVLLSIQAVRI